MGQRNGSLYRSTRNAGISAAAGDRADLAEARTADDDAQPDLQHPQPREEAKRKWGEETYRDDDHEVRRR